jgi:hypothetical protein
MLEEPVKRKADTATDDTPGWQCVDLVDAQTYLCGLGGRTVTVTLAGVLLPGCGGSNGMAQLVRTTGAGAARVTATSSQAFEFVRGLIRGATIRLHPLPGSADTLTANVRVGRDDLAAMLLEEGLAVVRTNATQGSGLLEAYQQRAIEAGRGIWQPDAALAERFTIFCNVSLESFNRRSGRGEDLDLPRFHAPDLVRAPTLRISDTIEDEASIATVCEAQCEISAHGPPRAYELDIELVPLLKANEYSGPLSSFKDTVGVVADTALVLRGGETRSLRLESAETDLSRVTRAAGIHVYSGAMISGYILNVRAEGLLVHSRTGEFAEAYTLELL